MSALRLPPEQLAELADLVADRLMERLAGPRADPALLSAAQVAERYGVTRSFVYDNAARLGAIRLGAGPRARLRFDPRSIEASLRPEPEPAAAPVQRQRRRSGRAGAEELLPVAGGDGA